MKSNVCKIENGIQDLEAILKESEKVAVYNELNHKQTLQLRLLCEEIDGMLPNIVNGFDGDFWIEFENGVCKINVSVELDRFTAEKKKDLVAIAKNKKNAAVVGIGGRIRSVLEDLFLDEAVPRNLNMTVDSFRVATSFSVGADYSYLWSLYNYKNTVDKEENAEDWDELEKSVIASVADDVIVGVKGKRANIIIVKNFAKE